jgi:hypothetical protein
MALARSFFSLVLACLVVSIGPAPSWASSAMVPVATASMVNGSVFRQGVGQPQQPLRQGDTVYEGDVVTTGPGGYVYLSTTDKAFLSVRPGSRLTIVNYQVNARNPSSNRIRIDLHQGVVRWVSGQGVSAARDRFRLNTPVAAIGVRGTDFSVFAESGVTRASVRSGRIAISPFNSVCSSAQLGPCGGEGSLDLDPGTAPVIQVLQGQMRPQLLQSIDLSPDKLVPPALDEQPAVPKQNGAALTNPSAASPPASSTAVTQSQAVATSPASSNLPGTTTTAVVNRLIELQVAGQVGSVEAAISSQPSADRIAWGRWRDIANLPATQSLDAFIQGRERAQVVGPFMVGRDQKSFNRRPETGLFAFELVDAQVVVLPNNPGSLQVKPASIVNPSLKVDFAVNRFYTEIGIRTDDGRVNALVAQGSVDKNGVLSSESRFSNGIVSGLLAGPDANQAGYVFHRSILGGAESAVGVTRWAR